MIQHVCLPYGFGQSLIGLLDSSLHLVSDSVIESWKLAADS